MNGVNKWLVLATVIVGTFLGRLDQTIVNLALPKIISSFNITVTSAAWIATAYIIANAVFVPVWGKLGDTIGRKKIYIWASRSSSSVRSSRGSRGISPR